MKDLRPRDMFIGIAGGAIITCIGIFFYAIARGYSGIFIFKFPEPITIFAYRYSVYMQRSNNVEMIVMDSLPSALGAIAICFIGSGFFKINSLFKCCFIVFLSMSSAEVLQIFDWYKKLIDPGSRFDSADIAFILCGCVLSLFVIKFLRRYL